MGIWDELARRLDLWLEDNEVKKPTLEDLDRFESEAGFHLPQDYRDYALTFGPGDIGSREWSFLTPGFPQAGKNVDLAEANAWHKKYVIDGETDAELARMFGDAARARRLVVFCSTRLVGDIFAWDPGEVTDAARHDYAIYMIPAEANNPPFGRIATSFREFVFNYALGGGHERHIYRDPPAEPSDLERPDKIRFQQAMIPTGG